MSLAVKGGDILAFIKLAPPAAGAPGKLESTPRQRTTSKRGKHAEAANTPADQTGVLTNLHFRESTFGRSGASETLGAAYRHSGRLEGVLGDSSPHSVKQHKLSGFSWMSSVMEFFCA